MRKTATRPAAVLASLSLLGMALTTQPASAGPAAPVAVAGVAAGNGALVTYGTTTAFVPRAFNSVGYAVHPYYYSDGETGDGRLAGEGWHARFGHLQEAGEALVATEWNESATCKTPEVGDDLITRYLPQHMIGLFVHSWDAPAGKLVDENYDPQDSTPSCGFTGATTAQQEFLRQAGRS